MTGSGAIAKYDEIIDSMIVLARAVKSHRIVAAGPDSAELLINLQLRGYARVVTMKSLRAARARNDVALVAWPTASMKDLEATLGRAADVLSASGVLVVWLGARDPVMSQRLRQALGRLGFRIESGTGCGQGVAVAARRLSSLPAAIAA